jgi:hypothetical protein
MAGGVDVGLQSQAFVADQLPLHLRELLADHSSTVRRYVSSSMEKLASAGIAG